MENNELKHEESITNESNKQKKKGRGPLYWVVVVAGVTFIVYTSIQIGTKVTKIANPEVSTESKTEETTSNESQTNNDKVQENKETKITDTIKIDYIKKQIAILEELPIDTTKIKISNEYDYFFPKTIYAFDNYKIEQINKEIATKAMISYSTTKTDHVTNVTLSKATKAELGDTDTYDYVSLEDMMPMYEKLFGTKEMYLGKIDYKCENYMYDNNIKAFVLYADGCGFVGPMAIEKTYIYDITEDNNNAYVYMAFGVLGISYEGNKYEIFTDYAMTQKYSGKATKDFVINETNYKDFTKYKYTFTKNSDGTYTFNNISKLK